MSACTLLPSSVSYYRKECFDLLEYAKANRNHEIFIDVTIQAGPFNIDANRMILSCYSTFFEKMFKSKMKERYEPSITIREIDPTTVKYLIDYMYEGNIIIDSANVMDVLAAADFLQLAEVKQFCFQFLEERITVNCWHAVLSAAKLYRSDQLQEHAYQFIADHFDEVIQNIDFKIIAKDDVTAVISILRKSDKTVDESVVCNLVINWAKQEEERNAVFADLFQMINLKRIPLQVLQTFSAETLFKNNAVCSNAVMSELFTLLKIKEQKCIEFEKEMQLSKIICLGGSGHGNKVIEIFNVLNTTERNYPELPYDVNSHCSLKLNDVIFCIGGRKASDLRNVYSSVCQMKLSETNLKWEKAAPMIEKRCNMGAAVFDGSMVVAGGWNGETWLESTEYCSDPSSKWQMAPSLKQRRSNNALVVCNDVLFALGGCDGVTCLSSVEQLHSLDGEWKDVAPMLTRRYGFAAACLNGSIYVIGGGSTIYWRSMLNSVERYDPAINKWRYVCEMKHKRSFHSVCILHGKIFIIGGFDADGKVVKDMEIYDPRKDKWIVSKSENSKYLFSYAAAITI